MLGSGLRSSIRGPPKRRSSTKQDITPEPSLVLTPTEGVAGHHRKTPIIAIPIASANNIVDSTLRIRNQKTDDSEESVSQVVNNAQEVDINECGKSKSQMLSRLGQQFKRRLSIGKWKAKQDTEVDVFEYTNDPTVAWEMLKSSRPLKLVRQMKPDTQIRCDAVRFVCMACMHQEFPDAETVPPGDILLVAGDFTQNGHPDQLDFFSQYESKLKQHLFTILIAGNHECSLDEHFMKDAGRRGSDDTLAVRRSLSDTSSEIKNAKSLLRNVIYLEDSSVELFGLQIYGTPWVPQYDDLAFNVQRGQAILEKWKNIPSGIDVLLTHTPPLGHGDLNEKGYRLGCVELLNAVVKRIKPKYHVFGHVHSGYGCTTDGYTKFINCSLMNDRMELSNRPVIFDVPIDREIKARYIHSYRDASQYRSN